MGAWTRRSIACTAPTASTALSGRPVDVCSRGWCGHAAPAEAIPLLTDIVAKVFLGCRTKIFRAADAFYPRRREGPYRFIQNRSRVAVVALKSDAAAEKPKDQLSRDFLGCSIFDFCNKICQQRKSLVLFDHFVGAVEQRQRHGEA